MRAIARRSRTRAAALPNLGPILAVALGIVALAVAAFTDPARASEETFGPQIGQTLPAPLEGVDQSGSARSAADLAGANGAVIMFYRSASWCPFCQKQLIDTNARIAEFNERGVSVVGVSYDSVEDLASFAERRGIVFSLLSDPDSALIDAYGVRDPLYGEGHRAKGVPYPITLVVDETGVVRAKLFHEAGYGASRGYVQRASIDDVLAAVDAELIG